MYNLTQENQPNAGKLIQSLRSAGYDNYSAISDIVDNAIDANSENIWIHLLKNKDSVEIIIADDGEGMDFNTLDQALKLGSLTDKDHNSDLGRYGMGLCTAALSLGKHLEVITKQKKSSLLVSIQDVDEIAKQNKFVKYLGEADKDAVKRYEFYIKNHSDSGTVILLKNNDKIQNPNVTIFGNKLKRDLGRIYRHFIKAGKNIFINGEVVGVNDPLMLDDVGTKIYSDEEYEVNIGDKKGKEKIRIKIAILPALSQELAIKLGVNQSNQGFYVLRNNREIASGKTLEVFHKHNDLNRLRIELFFPANIDEEMGVNFTKQEIRPVQSILDKIKEATDGQIRSIRKSLKREQVSEEEKMVDHGDAEKVIAQKAKLLITPDADIEKRKSPIHRGGSAKKSEVSGSPRENLSKTYTSPKGLGGRFEHVSLGENGPVYECYLEGKLVVVEWNTDHPFYQRMILQFKENKDVTNPIDYMVFAMATSELKVSNDENIELINNIKAIMSSNLRTLLS